MVADNFLIDFLEYITNPTGIVPWTLIIFSVLLKMSSSHKYYHF